MQFVLCCADRRGASALLSADQAGWRRRSGNKPLSELFASSSSYWMAAGMISHPILMGGKVHNNLKFAEEARQEIVLTYCQTIATAFSDVSNALVSCQESRENCIAVEKPVAAASESALLAVQAQAGCSDTENDHASRGNDWSVAA